MQTLDTNISKEASCVAYFNSLDKKIERLLRSGDASDCKPRWNNKSVFKNKAEGMRICRKIIQAVEGGDSWRNASLSLGLNDMTTKKWAQRHGLLGKHEKRDWSKHWKDINPKADKVHELRQRGALLKDALQRVGISETTYRRSFERRGKPLNPLPARLSYK